MLDEDRQSLFMIWLEEHGSSVMKVARAYTLTSEECHDLAQEILLQAWRSLPKFAGKASSATWFYRVALHTAMNWRRKDTPRRSRQEPLLEVQVPATDGADSVEHAQQRETVEQLYKAIHQLPKTDAALVLLYLDELSYRKWLRYWASPKTRWREAQPRENGAQRPDERETPWNLTNISRHGGRSYLRRASPSMPTCC